MTLATRLKPTICWHLLLNMYKNNRKFSLHYAIYVILTFQDVEITLTKSQVTTFVLIFLTFIEICLVVLDPI